MDIYQTLKQLKEIDAENRRIVSEVPNHPNIECIKNSIGEYDDKIKQLEKELSDSKPITIRDLIELVDKESDGDNVDWDEICYEMGINDTFWTDDDRLKAYFVEVWYCTDTWVGSKVYFLDDKPVAISYQSGRKSDEKFFWLDYENTYNYVYSLYSKEKPEVDNISLDDEFTKSEYYYIEYNSQIIHKQGYYNGELVDIVKAPKSWDNFHDITIKINDEEKVVDCRDLRFKFGQKLN